MGESRASTEASNYEGQHNPKKTLKLARTTEPTPLPVLCLCLCLQEQPVLHQAEVAHSENECIVCLAASKDAVLIPCGHICMCFECSKQVQASSNACPICRAQIDHAFQVL